ncbi:Na+/H+-dicarboxylate symporter [Anaerospora hongkongensis]|uniref:Na+/H+-dicarboxylate symporter n=1 Tax=Anaerospora hongkongensis TaxID=244830 RepID=A0A4R1Q475_9FIRM|nr:dicarboxylate/amino acid:cation symporter [Anaerospora hongkongensis]TCL38842.1 Na+/H+-dicarboxylate symporter [Anaerospora hongkongensis]
MFDWYRKMKLANKIFLAMILGSVVGMVAGPVAVQLKWIGDIWLNMLKMIIVPIVIFTVVQGITSMESPKALGRMAFRVTSYYIITTALAVLVGVGVAKFMQPGLGFVFEKGGKIAEVPKLVDFKTFFLAMFSDNMFASFTKGDILQVLVIAILIGVAIVFMPREKGQPVRAWFNSMSQLFMAVVGVIMDISPVGIFCLMASALGTYGLGFMGTMSKLIGAFYVACAVQAFAVYIPTVWLFASWSPIEFLKRMNESLVFAISACSSTAAIPINIRIAKEEFKVKDVSADFMIPFGTQINHDGSAIMLAVVIGFCMQAVGMDFTAEHLIQMVLLGVVVSMGGGGIPAAGVVKLMIVAQAFNVPLEIVAIVGSLYRLFDMGTTALNVIGDVAGVIIVDKFEKNTETLSNMG